MSAVTPVAAYQKLDSTSMLGTSYKTAIDGNSVAALRIVGRFAPRAQASPDMTIEIDAGNIFDGITLTEIAAQATGTITAPVSHPRIDRVVLNNTAGTIAVVTGTEAVSPVPPAITAGSSPIAQIALTTSTTSITDSIITDERNFGALSVGGFGAQTSISSASTCDLGTIISRNAKITGTTTISSFGSSANTQAPIYLIEFAGALTLTYNATNMILEGGKDIKTAAGDTAIAEDLGSGNWRVRGYSAASGKALVTTTTPGAKFGLKMTRVTSSTVSVGTGSCADSAGAVAMQVASTLTLDVTTTGANGLDTGSIAASSRYSLFVISGTAGTAVLGSLSATTPTLPSGYTLFRRIGFFMTDGSSNILDFVHVPETDTVFLASEILVHNGVSISAGAAVTMDTGAPTGARLEPLGRIAVSSNGNALIISSLDQPDVAPDNTGATANVDAYQPGSLYRGYNSALPPGLVTDTSAQIRIRIAVNDTYIFILKGWIDHAGRFA